MRYVFAIGIFAWVGMGTITHALSPSNPFTFDKEIFFVDAITNAPISNLTPVITDKDGSKLFSTSVYQGKITVSGNRELSPFTVFIPETEVYTNEKTTVYAEVATSFAVEISSIKEPSLTVALTPIVLSPEVQQLKDLQNKVKKLQNELDFLQMTANAKVITLCAFKRDLSVGISGDDVRCLQQYLNKAGHLVAVQGVGSPGNETIYFGERTRVALAKWQAAHQVTPSIGYFGSLSRAAYEKDTNIFEQIFKSIPKE